MFLATLRKARGLRGEIFADDSGTEPGRFAEGMDVTLFAPGAETGESHRVEHSWLHNGRLVLKFAGIDKREGAEAIQGWEVRILSENRAQVPDGKYFLTDLIGCSVRAVDGRPLGKVIAWYDDHAGPALLEVGGEKQFLVPLVPAICVNVDTVERCITMDLPEGLEDLNAS